MVYSNKGKRKIAPKKPGIEQSQQEYGILKKAIKKLKDKKALKQL